MARPERPELPRPVVDDEMTTMLPSKAAAVLPPPPDPHTARIPRQWSPVEQVLPKAAATLAPSHHIQPTLPSLSIPAQLAPVPRSAAPSVPVAPSSLGGLAMPSVDTTARVRTSPLAQGKLARPTLSWAAALVALGIFVGIGSAVVNRSDALKAKAAASAQVEKDKTDKGAKNAKGAPPAPAATAKLTAATALAANSPPPPPLPPSLNGDPPAPGFGAAAPQDPAAAAPATGFPGGSAIPMASATAAATPAPMPMTTPPPTAMPTTAPATADALVAAPAPRGRPAAAPAPAAAPRPHPARPHAAAVAESDSDDGAATAPAAAPEKPAPAPAAKGGKKKEIELSQQAKDLADEQLKSLLQ